MGRKNRELYFREINDTELYFCLTPGDILAAKPARIFACYSAAGFTDSVHETAERDRVLLVDPTRMYAGPPA